MKKIASSTNAEMERSYRKLDISKKRDELNAKEGNFELGEHAQLG